MNVQEIIDMVSDKMPVYDSQEIYRAINNVIDKINGVVSGRKESVTAILEGVAASGFTWVFPRLTLASNIKSIDEVFYVKDDGSLQKLESVAYEIIKDPTSPYKWVYCEESYGSLLFPESNYFLAATRTDYNLVLNCKTMLHRLATAGENAYDYTYDIPVPLSWNSAFFAGVLSELCNKPAYHNEVLYNESRGRFRNLLAQIERDEKLRTPSAYKAGYDYNSPGGNSPKRFSRGFRNA